MKTPDLSDSFAAAQGLLGWKLVYESPEGRTSGYIVETEAYDMSDPASHSFGGMRGRNVPMYQEAGTIYVYFTYGMHFCVNIVTGPKGHGQAVLIRALEPLEGIELMKKRRSVNDERQLMNGPAKLVQAMGITKADNANQLGKKLYLEQGLKVHEVVQTTRVGIKKAVDQPWRFFVKGNPYVSKP
jgi:DNA-3-methyladenine glycosylase